ncbi:MAG: hypothetical protein KKE64_01365 [Candidatus Omnitrophica bacterium]|nr:hypothetical protein [Candidatus Omnitrophota bacterium]
MVKLIFAGLFLFFSAVSFSEALNTTQGFGSGADSCSMKYGLVILIQFSDVVPKAERSFVEEKFNKLNFYVKQMSYQKVCLDVEVSKAWYSLPRPISSYKISSRNLEVDTVRVRRLIDDALMVADKDYDFSKYDFIAVVLNARIEDYGMIGLCGYPGMLGWENRDKLAVKSKEEVKGVAIFCYHAHIGTFFHDVAHVLGGVENGKRRVPCLYDHDLQAKPGDLRETFNDSVINMGFWDPMSCHYSEHNVPPPGISSWTKLRLGWLPEERLKVVDPKETTEILLGPLEDAGQGIAAVKIPLSKDTYYLVENRQPIGLDQYLPGSGVLIMYADDSIGECRHGQAPVKLINAQSVIPRLNGAAFDLEKNNLFTDKKNKIKIELLEKLANSYKIRISPYQSKK